MFAHAQAPVRIGIAGGGTDLPIWTKDRTGYCLSLAIAPHTHAVAILRSDRRVVASYRRLDEGTCVTEIANGLIRESALLHNFEDGFEVHTLSEVSSQGSGLGVSSSIAVALVACFTHMSRLRRGIYENVRWQDGSADAFRTAVARDAWTVEIDRLRRPVGRQDHMAASWGGLRLYRFEGDEAVIEETFSEEDAAWVAEHIAIIRLSEGHDSRMILSNIQHAATLQAAYEAVPVAKRAIAEKDVQLLGRAFDLGHQSKLAIRGAVPDPVIKIVQALKCYTYGCKVAGAGGGGHIVVVCDKGDEVLDQLREVTELDVVRVRPDFQGVRSEVTL